jgi:lysophospholipase L1-like esterase
MKIVIAISAFILFLGCGGSTSLGIPAQNKTQNGTFVVYIGDSIFLYYTTPDPTRCPSSPGLPHPGLDVSYNNDAMAAALSATAAPAMELRFGGDVVTPCHAQALPCMAVVEGGHNDVGYILQGWETISEMQAAAQDIITQSQNAAIPLIILNVPPSDPKYDPTGARKQNTLTYNSWLASQAASLKAAGVRIQLADVWSAMADSNGDPLPGMLFDGVHPTQQGMITMNQVMTSAMTPFLQ